MRTERFNKAYDALVKAFFEGTLVKGNCHACAVGNMINYANNIGYNSFHKNDYGVLISNSHLNGEWHTRLSCKVEPEKGFLNNTGYNGKELLLIEEAFESNTKISPIIYISATEQEILEDQFNGLCAVVDVLLKLDGITPEDHYKNKFREHPALCV